MDAIDRLNRRLREISQAELARRTGVPQSAISLISRRIRRPTLGQCPRLNRELGTSYEDWIVVRLIPLPRRRKAAA